MALACAVDGSRVSKKALDLSVRLLSKRKGGTLDLLHVVEPKASAALGGSHPQGMRPGDLQRHGPRGVPQHPHPRMRA